MLQGSQSGVCRFLFPRGGGVQRYARERCANTHKTGSHKTRGSVAVRAGGRVSTTGTGAIVPRLQMAEKPRALGAMSVGARCERQYGPIAGWVRASLPAYLFLSCIQRSLRGG